MQRCYLIFWNLLRRNSCSSIFANIDWHWIIPNPTQRNPTLLTWVEPGINPLKFQYSNVWIFFKMSFIKAPKFNNLYSTIVLPYLTTIQNNKKTIEDTLATKWKASWIFTITKKKDLVLCLLLVMNIHKQPIEININNKDFSLPKLNH